MIKNFPVKGYTIRYKSKIPWLTLGLQNSISCSRDGKNILQIQMMYYTKPTEMD